MKPKANICPIFNIFVEVIAIYPKISIFFIFSRLKGLQATGLQGYRATTSYAYPDQQLNYVKNICIQLHGYLKTLFCHTYVTAFQTRWITRPQKCKPFRMGYLANVVSPLHYTVNRETFTGLNFRNIHSTWIFAVIHSQYKARDQYIMFILRAKIHRKNFHASLKDRKNRKSLAQ